MFKNFLKSALRNLGRNKTFTIINTAGLMVGIAASILIFLVVQYQSGFDSFHPKKDSIYRVGTEFHNADGIDYSDAVSFPVADGIRIDFPEIKEVAAIFRTSGQISVAQKQGDQAKFIEQNFFYSEPEFFKMFNFPFLQGSATAALDKPNNAVMTKAAAEKYFGSWKNAIGKTFSFDNTHQFTVTGILEDVPPNTDFPLSVVVPYSALKQTEDKERFEDWVSTFGDANTFIVLPSNISPAQMNRRLTAFAQKHKPKEYQKDGYVLQPLSEIHYDERFGNYNHKTFSHSLINSLSLIGLFLLVIACVNFINLATAQAVNRSKEVGLRKVLGSSRKQLVLQFLMEISVIVFFSCVLGAVIASVMVPYLNNILEAKMSFQLLQNPMLLTFLLAVFITASLLSGVYPAFVLSGFNPVRALKNRLEVKKGSGISLRRTLVVFQFVIAQVLIIAMMIVVNQLQFFRNAPLGFDRAAVVNVPVPGDSLSKSKTDFLKNQLLANSSIENVSFSFAPPSSNSSWNSDFKFDHAANSTNFNANLKWADPDYFKTFNIKFVAGRPFQPSDTVREFVVNETLLHKLGITNPEDALGKEIDFWDGHLVAKIVGVIRDFNSYSLRQPMAPVVMSTYKDTYRTINIKIKAGREKEVLASVEKLYNSVYPREVYSYKFLDETINNFYKSENQLAILYKIFSILAIFISCLGLYGLVSFMAVQRKKEVGVRKVLGATSTDIVFLMSREFTLLILLAFVISAPIGWYIMHQWLQNFTYRIAISPLIFVAAITGSILIAWITVGHRALKTANTNPVKSLRSE